MAGRGDRVRHLAISILCAALMAGAPSLPYAQPSAREIYVPPPPPPSPSRTKPLPTPETEEERPRPSESDSPPATERPPAPPSEHNSGDIESLVGPIIFIGLLTAFFGSASQSSSTASASDLRKNGPKFPETYPVGTFPTWGFVASGWPVVVDFEAQPGTITSLSIRTGERTWSTALNNDGLGGRHLVRVTYDGSSAADPTPSLFTVESVLAQNGVAIRDEAGRLIGSPVEVYGIGAGVRAVGSVAIDRLSFRRTDKPAGEDFARYSYQAAPSFRRMEGAILRYEPALKDGVRVITAKRVRKFVLPPSDIGAGQPGSWNGQTDAKKASYGRHRLQVRGWEVQDDNWVGAISPSVVVIP